MHKEDGEKKSLTDNEQGAGKYQSVDKDEVSNGMQHNVPILYTIIIMSYTLDKNMYGFHAYYRKCVGYKNFLHILFTKILPYPLPNMCRRSHVLVSTTS